MILVSTWSVSVTRDFQLSLEVYYHEIYKIPVQPFWWSNPKFISIHFRRNRRHQIINPITWISFRRLNNQLSPTSSKIKFEIMQFIFYRFKRRRPVIWGFSMGRKNCFGIDEVTYWFEIIRLSRVRIYYRACQQSAEYKFRYSASHFH